MRQLYRVIVTALWFAALPAWAETATPIVRAEAAPAQVMVGESTRLRVTILVPTWFTKPSSYPSFELTNTITRLPADSTFNLSERIGGETWTGIVRDYRINPQIAARYEISGKSVRVVYAHPDTRQPTTIDVPVPAVSFEAVVPAGAESLTPFLTGTNGSIERQVEGDLENLEVGDAIVVTVTAKLQGMPVMFLPELAPPVSALGLESYPQEPALTDGDAATRVEQVTYVFNGGGEFTLPALTLKWWDKSAQTVDEASAPALRFTVAGAPAAPPTSQLTESALPWWVYVAAVVAAGVILYGLVAAIRPIYRTTARYIHARRTQALASETYAFGQLQQAVRDNDKQAFERWQDEWLKRLDGQPTLAHLSAISGQPLYDHIMAMHRAQYGKQNGSDESAAFTAKVLCPLFENTRKGYLAAREQTHVQYLAPLNPTATKTR